MNDSLAFYVSALRKDFSDYCARRLMEVNLSVGQLYFILYVGKHPHCSPSNLSKALKMDGGHTTRTLNKLEQNGFLIQTRDPQDRRAVRLHLTQAGEEAFAMSCDLFAQWDEVVLQDFSEEERTLLLRLLKRLIPPNPAAQATPMEGNTR